MKQFVKVGASIPKGIEGVKLFQKLKLGNFILTKIPTDFNEAIKVAKFCRRNKIYFAFSEFLFRGIFELLMSERKKIKREEFFTKEELEKIFKEGGKYYLGRMTLGEVGGLLYWPKEYTINRATGNYINLPFVETVKEAKDLYVDYMKKVIDFEREISGGNLLNVDSSITFKYQLEAGIDIPVLESMPGNCDLLYSAIRGASRAYKKKEWGAHIAMGCYGGSKEIDDIWLKRWKVSLYYSYISGATFIYPESGHFTYGKYDFHSKEMLEVRRILREFFLFSQIHKRPSIYPEVKIGFVHGNLDGFPGLWNKYVWGQYKGNKWKFKDAEYGWEYLDYIYRKEDWFNPNVKGYEDFSGHPPYGLYDVVPVEAPFNILKQYSCLIFLGWNTMTDEIYEKLKEYVKNGGHLIISLLHLNISIDRESPPKLYREGDFTDLFGVKIKGKYKPEIAGVKYINSPSFKKYIFSQWPGDPKFIGEMIPAKVEIITGKIVAGMQKKHAERDEEIEKRPLLIENVLGKGNAFLITSFQYPGARGMKEFMKDILRAVFAGEQGDIRINGNDRVRHAVYKNGNIRVLYLLNTDLDVSAVVKIWINDKYITSIIPPADIRIFYIYKDKVLLEPEDKFFNIEKWIEEKGTYKIEYISLKTQSIYLYNLIGEKFSFIVDGKKLICCSEEKMKVIIKKKVDKTKPYLFKKSFMEEPKVEWKKEYTLPY